MKVLTVRPGPAFSVSDVYRGYVKALRAAGCQVLDFNFDDRLGFYEKAMPDWDVKTVIRAALKGLEAVVYEFWPDVIVFVSGFYVDPWFYDLFRSRGHRVVLIHTESPYEDTAQIGVAGRVDVNVVNDPANIEKFRAENPHTIYLPHAYDPDIHRPDGPSAPPCDVCFVGTGFADRIAFFEQVAEKVDVTLAGNWQQLPEHSPLRECLAHDIDACVDNLEAVRLYRAAKASVNLYRRDTLPGDSAHGWAMGPREVELAATGCFYLTEPRGENREVLPMVPTFDGPEDFAEKAEWWLACPTARDKTTERAWSAIEDRTFDRNVRYLLSEVECSR